jgi:plastocyanin
MDRTRSALTLPAALLLAFAASAGHAADETITTAATVFISPNRTIQTGDKVTWSNASQTFHNVRSEDAGFRCANGCDGEGGNGAPSTAAWSFTRTFNSAGSFVYYCEIHGSPSTGMRGVITVEQGGGGGTAGALRLSASNYNVNEGAGNVTLVFQRVNGDDGAVSVQYATSNGSASAGSDYTAKSGTVNWADNDDNNKTVNVAILNDAAQESAESFTVTLSAPGGGASLGSPASATVTIADNDGGGGGNPPAAPSELKAASQSQTQIQLNWKDNAGNETGFVIEMRTGTGSGAFSQVGTAGANATGATIAGLSPATYYTFRVRATNAGGASANSNLASATTDTAATACVSDDDTLCLNGNRFRVEVDWETTNPAQTGIGHRVVLTPDTGYFWFFASTNVEMVIKVLNACGLNSRYWVFAGGLTNVKVVITVTDSQTGKVVTYINPPNTTFQPIQDTGAFATCP